MNKIETHVLELIGEDTDSPDVFTESNMTPIRDSINDAIEEICILTGNVKETYHIALRSGRSFYRFRFEIGYIAWITDIWLFNQKRRLEQTSLIKLNEYNPRWLYNDGSPERYFPIGMNYFGIHPKPSSDTDILEINAVVIPKRYEKDTDKINLRKNWEWAAAHYAVGEYYASIGDAKSAIVNHNRYLKRMGLSWRYPAYNERTWKLQNEVA